MFKNILVVCVGNICRSPTAEALLQHHLQGRGLDISSAGVGALVDKPMDATARELLQEHGLDLPEHQARQLTRDLAHRSDLILVMEQKHLSAVLSIAPEARGKTFLLGKWLKDKEIPDPYRQQRPAFEHVYRLIEESVRAWQPYIR